MLLFLNFHAMTILGKLVDCCFVGISVRWIIVAIFLDLHAMTMLGKLVDCCFGYSEVFIGHFNSLLALLLRSGKFGCHDKC